jgi:hypothetical protein
MHRVPEPRRTVDIDEETSSASGASELAIFVLFTSVDWTLKALEKACEIARPLEAKVVVVVIQAVPFPLPLDTPIIPLEWVIRRFEEKVGDLPDDSDIKILVYLCRDRASALKRVLNPVCPVVIGMKKRWWPTQNERITRNLRRAGYEVVSVISE